MAVPSAATTECTGILLAAGASTRLSGRSKQLLQRDGEPLVHRQARLLLDVCRRVVVVTGAAAADVEAALADLPVDCRFHVGWRQGMGSSLAAGVRAAGAADAMMVLLVDQWRIDANDLAALSNAAREHPGRAVAACWPGCAAGAPAVFPATWFSRLEQLRGDRGARSLLADPGLDVLALDLPHAAHDLDTPAELAAFEARKT